MIAVPHMWGYGTSEVAKMVGLTPGQVRGYVRMGFVAPERGARGALRFCFQDLVLLRTAKGLLDARMPARKVRRALKRLRDQLPPGRPLSGVTIQAERDQIVVRDGHTVWQPETGQALFDFDVKDLAAKVAPIARRAYGEVHHDEVELGAHDWYEWGCDLETAAPDQARDAYRRALELEPHHADAHLNLGRLLHEGGDAPGALAHYRLALAARPADATAAFNLGVALEDVGRPRDAVTAYGRAVACDPGYADAHYNLGRLYERLGQPRAALRHLKVYRRLTMSR